MSSNPFDEFKPAPPADPFEEFERATPAVRPTLAAVATIKPDDMAEAERLAKRYPAPVDTLYRNLADVRVQAAVDAADERLKTSPKLAKAMAENARLAALAQDDIEPLAALEQFGADLGGAAKAGVFRASRGAAGTFQALLEFVAPALDVFEPSTDAQMAGWRGDIGGNPLRRLAEGFAIQGAGAGETAKAARPKTDGVVMGGFFSGVESLTQNVLALPMAFMPGGQPAALSMMTATTGGDAYQTAREKGLSMQQALPYAASQAAIEYATEKLPLGALLKDVKAGTPFFQTLMRQVALEIPGEQIATLLQDLNDWAILNPEKPFSSYIEERPSAAAQTLVATIVGSGGSVAVVKGIEAVVERASRDGASMQRAGVMQQALEQALKSAEGSALRERNPEQFRALMTQMADDGAIYVDAEVLNQMPAEVLQQLQGVAEELPAALATGSTVQVKLADVLTFAPGTPAADLFLQNARSAPDAMTAAEAEQAGKKAGEFLQQEAERVIQQAQDQEAMRTSAEVVRSSILSEITATGRYRPAVAEGMSQWASAFYTTMASRVGMTPEAFYQQYRLRILGEPSAAAAGPVMDQVAPLADGYQSVQVGDTAVEVSVKDGHAEINMVRTPEDKRGQGSARAALEQVLRSADAQGLTVTLTPEPMDRKTSKAKLEKFYRSLGFVPNKGRNKDFRYSGAMIRAPRQQTLNQPGTPAFDAWFGDSKVRDAEGKPLVVYHGTRAQFEVFDYSKIGQQGRSEGAGFYFTNSKDVASGYGPPLEVFLSIRNPLAYDAPGFSKAVVQKIVKRVAELEAQAEGGDIADGFLANFGDVRSEGLQRVVREAADIIAADETALDQLSGIVGSGVNPEFVNRATRDVTGHDGVVAEGFSNEGSADNRIFVAFFPEQIKSAIGNNGNFDPQNPSILEQAAPPAGFTTKLVGRDGKPLVMYHGTAADIRKFDPNKIGDNFGADERGFFFISDPKQASDYVENDTIGVNKRLGANVMPVYLDLKKPLVIDDAFLRKEGMAPIGKNDDVVSFWDTYQSLILEWVDARRADGVVLVDNTYQLNGEPTRMAVAFKPKQIVSAISGQVLGQGPRGTFNPRTLELVLNPNANLSTFFHETGHFFLEVMADIASQPNAPAQIAEDMSTFLKWAGITGDEDVGGADSGAPLEQSADEPADAWVYKYWRSRTWDSEEQAREMIRARIAEDNERYPMFKPNDPAIVDGLKFTRAAAAKTGWNKGKPQVKLKTPRALQEKAQGPALSAEPEGSDPAPVDWESTDLQGDSDESSVMSAYGRGKGVVYRAWMDPGSIPTPKGAGITKEGLPSPEDYDWSELSRGRGSPPPLKVRISARGKVELMDGNHRLAWYLQEGYSDVPAYVIDERKGAQAPEVLEQNGQPTPDAPPVQRKRTALETWNAMTLDQKRKYHERWAESVEQYVMEGKAPSVELQPLMRRFATWLKSVYGSIKRFLESRGQAVGGGGEALNQMLAPEAVRAEMREATNPITRKPVFVLFDAEGNELGTTRSADDADQAVARFNRAQELRSQPTPMVNIDSAPAAAPSQKRATNWKIVRGQKFTNLDEDDGFLYHVTSHQAALSIIKEGLVPNSGRMFGDVYAGHSANRVFLTERSGVSFWMEKVEQWQQHNSDRPPAVAVARIPKDKITAPLQPDPIGTEDARRLAYYAEGQVLRQEDGKFKPDGAQPQQPGPQMALNDDIRRVMDRMLATDEQIAQANEVAGLVPDVDADATAAERLNKRSMRDLALSVKARDRAIADLRKEAKALEKAIREEVTVEVDQSPEMRAKKALDALSISPEYAGLLAEHKAARKAAETATRDEVKAALLAENPDAKGLAKGQLLMKNKRDIDNKVDAAMIKWDAANPAPKRPVNATDADVATIADSFGFESVDAMLQAVDAYGPRQVAIDGITDRRMLEEHGDLIDERAIAEAANEAVHNTARARSLATELRTQAEMLGAREDTGQTNAKGSKITVNALVEAAKQFGANVVARTPLRDLKAKAWQHTAAERRAGKRWQEATAAGKTADAVKAKQDQVLNNAAAKAAIEAQAEAKKILDFFRRVTKGNDETVVEKGRDADIVNAARAVLKAYGVESPASKGAEAYLEALSKNDPETYNVVKPMVDAATANAQPLDALTFEELQALNEEVQAMWFLAKRSRQMEVDGDLLDVEEVADEVYARLEEIGIPDTIPGETGALTRGEIAARQLLQQIPALLRRVEQWAEAKDGKFGGPFLRFIFQPVKDAADRYRTARLEYRQKFQALVDNIATIMPAGTIAAPELGYTFGRGHNGIGHAELLHAIAHTGNASNKRKLLLGRGWATENPDGTLDTAKWDAFVKRMADTGVLQPAHYDFVQGVWDLMEETKPLAQKTHRDVFGRYFAEVTAESFTDPWGQARRGGYVPAQADPLLVQDADLRELLETENAGMSQAFPATNKGFTKARVDYNRPLKLDLRTLPQHIDKVLLFSHMEPAVRGVAKLLRQKKVSQPLARVDPAAMGGMLKPWLNRAARQTVETPISADAGLNRVASTVRGRVGMALMFANVSNTLQQITGFLTASIKVKPNLMRRATAQYIANPSKFKESVWALSPYMADRSSNEVAVLSDTLEAILINPSVYQRAESWTRQHGYFMQTFFDNQMSPIIWSGAYNQALAEGMDERMAIRYADGVIRQTQGSTLPEDVSRIETGPAYARLFTQFVSYFNMMANTNGTAVQQILAEQGLKKGAGKAAGVLLIGLLAPIWVAEAIAHAMRGGPEDEDEDGYLDDWLAAVFGFGTIRGILAGVPFLGAAAQSAVNRFNDQPADDKFSLSPTVSVLESAVGAPASVYKAIVDDASAQKAVRDASALITVLTGLPAMTLARPVGYAAGVADGKIEPTGPFDFTRGVITGTASPESKQQ